MQQSPRRRFPENPRHNPDRPQSSRNPADTQTDLIDPKNLWTGGREEERKKSSENLREKNLQESWRILKLLPSPPPSPIPMRIPRKGESGTWRRSCSGMPRNVDGSPARERERERERRETEEFCSWSNNRPFHKSLQKGAIELLSIDWSIWQLLPYGQKRKREREREKKEIKRNRRGGERVSCWFLLLLLLLLLFWLAEVLSALGRLARRSIPLANKFKPHPSPTSTRTNKTQQGEREEEGNKNETHNGTKRKRGDLVG